MSWSRLHRISVVTATVLFFVLFLMNDLYDFLGMQPRDGQDSEQEIASSMRLHPECQ